MTKKAMLAGAASLGFAGWLVGCDAALANPDACTSTLDGLPSINGVECYGNQSNGVGLGDINTNNYSAGFIDSLAGAVHPNNGVAAIEWDGGTKFSITVQEASQFSGRPAGVPPVFQTNGAPAILINSAGAYTLDVIGATLNATGAAGIQLHGSAIKATLNFDKTSTLTSTAVPGIRIDGGSIDATIAYQNAAAPLSATGGFGIDMKGGPIAATLDGTIAARGGVRIDASGANGWTPSGVGNDGLSGGAGANVTIRGNTALTLHNTGGDEGILITASGGAGGAGAPGATGSQFGSINGGNGGNGGDSGAIAVGQAGVGAFTADITTKGGRGISLLSIGGAAGVGGAAGNGGGAGALGNGGSGGAIALGNVALTISTTGDNAQGVYAESRGASGNYITGNGGSIDLDVSNALGTKSSIVTTGKGSQGLFAMSIGSLSGPVTINLDGSVSTGGDNAQGILAESFSAHGVGGNVNIQANGTGALTVSTKGANAVGVQALSQGTAEYASGDVTVGNGRGSFQGNVTTTGDNAAGVKLESLGGADRNLNGGNGGQVDIYGSQWTISTKGANSAGIFARSVGGGSLYGRTADGNYINLNIERCGGAAPCIQTSGAHSAGIYGLSLGSNAAGVTIYADTSIETTGAGSDGIYAYSNGVHGAALPVTVTAGDIKATGAGSNGVEARNYAGEGYAWDVTVDVKGKVTANADGVLADSIGKLANGNVKVTVESGASVSGATGVHIVNASAAQIDNHGVIGSTPDGTAIRVDAAKAGTTVNNDGAIIGAVKMKGALNNNDGGVVTIGAGGSLDLGGGTFTNANGGKLVVVNGGASLNGNFVQQPGGLLDVYLAATNSDYLSVKGHADFVAGGGGGGLRFDFAAGFNPVGDSFTFFDSTNTILGLDVLEGITPVFYVGDTLKNFAYKIVVNASGERAAVEITGDNGIAGIFGSYLSYGPPLTTAVPEPSTWAMLGMGFAGMAGVAGRRARKRCGGSGLENLRA